MEGQFVRVKTEIETGVVQKYHAGAARLSKPILRKIYATVLHSKV